MNMVRLVGRWFGMTNYCINFSPEYRHVKIKKVLSKPYAEDGQMYQDVLVTAYGYKYIGRKTAPYLSITTFYAPTQPLFDLIGRYQIKYDRIAIGSFTYLTAITDPLHNVAVTERFGRD